MKTVLKITLAASLLFAVGTSGYFVGKSSVTQSPPEIARGSIVNGVPGDRVTVGRDGTVYINGQPATETMTIVEKQYKVDRR